MNEIEKNNIADIKDTQITTNSEENKVNDLNALHKEFPKHKLLERFSGQIRAVDTKSSLILSA
ncbi:MAG: hypothetical protein ACRC4L_03490, partial [Mycoplasma sp.]